MYTYKTVTWNDSFRSTGRSSHNLILKWLRKKNSYSIHWSTMWFPIYHKQGQAPTRAHSSIIILSQSRKYRGRSRWCGACGSANQEVVKASGIQLKPYRWPHTVPGAHLRPYPRHILVRHHPILLPTLSLSLLAMEGYNYLPLLTLICFIAAAPASL
jgi:hypothetical protein